ncbi:Metacaspase-1 [Seminavis robusta]|uniref:Metacaspase-1 n=1 Tax=Seminavis robusta TaxID=568900 RepID=A0A9N8ERR0_9STRA|nr:Metacaspase-1 [Seminavis robusta]|eukprot:Sro1758_g295720.1 Metacaspase-1 (315) ;mRNA; r:6925-8647
MSDVEKAEGLIGAEVHMISGCRDEQTSADVSNVANFSLPDPAGRAGGACTSAMLKVLYADHKKPDDDLSYQEVLLKMREILQGQRFTQIPQLSSSRSLNIKNKFAIVPDDFSGTRRAVMIGINYVGQQGELSGCHNDVKNMIEYIKDIHGFEDENITILMDDGENISPTYENIMNAYKKLVEEAEPGDACFCHYSGHGGKIRDDDGDEKDGYDETLVPLDYGSAGQIRDDDIYKTLVLPMKKGVNLTSVMDCCHSGTVLDLPFVFVADGSQEEMTIKPDFDMQKLEMIVGLLQAAAQNEDVMKMAMKMCGCNIL